MIKIKKEVLKDGTVRWRARGVSTGKDPATGKRTQRTITGPTRKAVEAEVRRIGHQVDKGTYVKPWDGTLSELLDAYLRAATRGKEANTVLSYSNALRIPRERLGRRRALSITRDDIEQLADFALTEGRKVGGKPGTGLGVRSVRLMLQQLSAAFERAVDDEKLPRNPCRKVKVAGETEREDTTWTEPELQRFLAAAASDRLWAAWLLSALGLRRGEVLGLKWGDISFTDQTLSVRRSRVLAGGVVIEKGPKSRRSWRVLPLFEPVSGALEALYKAQLAEKAAAGPAYAGEVDDSYVCCDELGRPVHPEHYSDEFHRIAAGLPRIRLHDTRGSVNSYLERLGVPETLRAAWLGHTIQVNKKSYLARPKDLTPVSDTIGSLFKADVSKV